MRQRCGVFLLVLSLAIPVAGVAKSKDEDSKKPKDDVGAIGDRDVDGSLNFYSIEKEIALGKQMADEVQKTAKIVDDPVISEYVNRVGQNLVRNSDAKVPFTIKVIDSDEVNAFALPGGFFFVNTGIIELAENEAEMAGVMAHEIAHVAARHGTRQATRGQVANLASIPLIFLGGWTGYGIRQAAGLAIPMTFLRFSRGFEKEADFLGVQYLYASGYDPSAMVQFFERLKAQEKKKPNAFAKVFSSHPMTKDRIKLVQNAIDDVLPSKPQYAINTSEFEQVKQRLAALTSHRRETPEDPNRPTLRRKPSEGTVEPGGQPGGDEDNDRPVLKRREPAEGTTTDSGNQPTADQDNGRPVLKRSDPGNLTQFQPARQGS
jgi:predicted Zn-dependent protease